MTRIKEGETAEIQEVLLSSAGIVDTHTELLTKYLRLYFLPLLLGSLGAFAQAPYHWIPFFLIAIVGFLWLLPTAKRSIQAFFMGYAFGFGYYSVGLHWLYHAFIAANLDYLAPIGIVGIPLFVSPFIGLITWILYKIAHTPFARALGFTVLWGLWEWFLGHYLLTGFPWSLAGYIWTLPVLQVTAITGVYGLSLLTLLSFSLIATKKKSVIALCSLLIVALWSWGSYRLHVLHPTTEVLPINLRIVHPAIEQKDKWERQLMHDNLMRHIQLSKLPAEKPLHGVIWPESAVPFFVEQQPLLRTLLQEAVPPGGVVIFGAPRLNTTDDTLHVGLFIMNDKAEIVSSYDKAHLVPFGEYIPLKATFPILHRFIHKLTYGARDYTPGKGLQTLHIESLPPFSPLICYEAIFSGAVTAPKDHPLWLLNVTNDAWYGHSAGPYQHLHIIRVRAIEEGLPLIRAVNNGISAVIDPLGRLVDSLDIDEFGFIDFHLPKHLDTRTFYSKSKDLFFWSLLSALAAVLCVAFWREKQKNESRP